MRLEDFNYDFPPSLIAHEPLTDRTQSKLLVYKNHQSIEHLIFNNLKQCLPNGSLLVLNQTKVFAARWRTQTETGAKLEIFFMEPISEHSWRVLIKPSVRLKPFTNLFSTYRDKKIILSCTGLVYEDGSRAIKSNLNKEDMMQWLDIVGETPLPPYIKRDLKNNLIDSERYQTVFAQERGSSAAPTAALHFDRKLLNELAQSGIEFAEVCLHVGGGTFLPVRQEDVSQHDIHKESYFVPSKTASAILKAKSEGRDIIAVGTTSFRAIESIFLRYADINSWEGLLESWLDTNLYIYPKSKGDRYQSQVFSGIITNFHQPKSTLFMLICALVGYEHAKSIYAEAIAKNYRLFSYGDSSLLWFK